MACKFCQWGVCDRRIGICKSGTATTAQWLEPGPAGPSSSGSFAEVLAEAVSAASQAAVHARAAADAAKHLPAIAEHAAICAEVAAETADKARLVALGGVAAQGLTAAEQMAVARGGAQEAAEAADALKVFTDLNDAAELAHTAAVVAQQAAEAAWPP